MGVPPSLISVQFTASVVVLLWICGEPVQNAERAVNHHQTRLREREKGLSLWIDQNQVKLFSGFPMEIFVIADGQAMPYILDPNFEKHLPVIPAEVASVNFTWKSGGNKYLYKFSKLKSFDEGILDDPVIAIGREGKVPRKPKVFSILLPCSGNVTGVASFGIGLMIKNRKQKRVAGMPLKLKLQKRCAKHSPDPECDKKCADGGKCNQDKLCQCAEGYMGQYCSTGRGDSPLLSTVYERQNLHLSRCVQLCSGIPRHPLRRRDLCQEVPERREVHSEGHVLLSERLFWTAVRVQRARMEGDASATPRASAVRDSTGRVVSLEEGPRQEPNVTDPGIESGCGSDQCDGRCQPSGFRAWNPCTISNDREVAINVRRREPFRNGIIWRSVRLERLEAPTSVCQSTETK